jgi:ATP-dependent DNA helicase RecG
MEDLSASSLARYVREAGQEGATPEHILDNLGLGTSQGLTNAANLLFAANPQRLMPSALVRCARFAGTDSVDFLDQRVLQGRVMEQIDGAISFVEKHILHPLEITGNAQSQEVPDLPLLAVREAVINAVCHRDYAASGNVQVQMHDDRLEVWNPGGLPADLSVEMLFEPHPSRPRNKLLASVLAGTSYIEHWGTGTRRMVQACRDMNLPLPEFSSGMGTFMVTLRRGAYVGFNRNLSPRQEHLLELLDPTQPTTAATLAKRLGLTQRLIQSDLKALVARGRVVRQGGGRTTAYLLRK